MYVTISENHISDISQVLELVGGRFLPIKFLLFLIVSLNNESYFHSIYVWLRGYSSSYVMVVKIEVTIIDLEKKHPGKSCYQGM